MIFNQAKEINNSIVDKNLIVPVAPETPRDVVFINEKDKTADIMMLGNVGDDLHNIHLAPFEHGHRFFPVGRNLD